MDKQAFKQRMQNLKSYRENNPGKDYWDWKVQAYQNGGRHALGVGQVFASLADMLFNKERRTPAIAAAAYYTIHQTQNDPVLAPVEAPLVEPIADAIKSVDETPYDPGEVFLLSPENQKKQMTKNPNYRVVDTNSEEDPYGIVRRAANYHKEIHGEVPVYEYIADSDTTIKRSNLIPVGTLPLGEYTPELPHAGSYNSVLYYNASNDKLYQRAYDLNDYGPTDTKDKGASSMYIGPIRWLSRQLDKAGTPFVQRTGFVPLDEGKYYNQLPESAKKKVRERRRLRNSYEYGGEVNEFQRKTRRDIMQESLVDGRPDYNKMFQNQNEYQKDFANYWYTERAKNPKYSAVGDVLSAKEAYDAVKQNDWLGAGLAGLGFIPFIPKGVRRIARQTPTVNRTFEQKVAEMEKRVGNRRKMMEEFYDQRNRTYELLNTPEARRRAADIDQKYGTEYNKVYDELTKEYEDVTSYVNMVEPEFVKDPDAFARINPSETGKKISLSEDNITKPEDFPTGLIRHEIGHYVDEMAYPGGVPNNAYLRQLGKPSKYRPFEEVKDIFRSPDKALQDYRYLRNPTEKKSIMNQFDEYLMNNYTPSTYPQTTKEFKEAIEKAPDIHRNMKLLLKIHNKPSILFKDFKNRPLVNNTTKDKNKELV